MKKPFCIFFQSPRQLDMKNIVEFWKDFLGYFNALETYKDKSQFYVPTIKESGKIKARLLCHF